MSALSQHHTCVCIKPTAHMCLQWLQSGRYCAFSYSCDSWWKNNVTLWVDWQPLYTTVLGWLLPRGWQTVWQIRFPLVWKLDNWKTVLTQARHVYRSWMSGIRPSQPSASSHHSKFDWKAWFNSLLSNCKNTTQQFFVVILLVLHTFPTSPWRDDGLFSKLSQCLLPSSVRVKVWTQPNFVSPET